MPLTLLRTNPQGDQRPQETSVRETFLGGNKMVERKEMFPNITLKDY